MDNENFRIEESKKNIRHTMWFFGSILFFIFLLISILGLLTLIPDLVLDKKSSNSANLGGFGSYMNVMIAITSAFTVGLVFYGVRMQSLEFRSTNQKLQKQIENSKREEAINRAIKILEQWNDEIEHGSDYLKEEEKSFIRKIFFLYKDTIKDEIDYKLLSQALIHEKVLHRISEEIIEIEFEIERQESILCEECDFEKEIFQTPCIHNLAKEIEKQREENISHFCPGDEEDIENHNAELAGYDSISPLEEAKSNIYSKIEDFKEKIEPLYELRKALQDAAK